MIELLQKCLKQPESNPELYYFMEDALTRLDQDQKKRYRQTFRFFLPFTWRVFSVCGSMIIIQKKKFPGFQEGYFTEEKPSHPHFLEDPLSGYSSTC